MTEKTFSSIPVSIKNELLNGGYKSFGELKYRDLSIPVQELKIKGEHNYYNVLASMVTSCHMGIKKTGIYKSITAFKGLEHRTEFVASVNGVLYYNDSKATNLDASRYALSSFDQPVIWIMGGIDKGNNYNDIWQIVKVNVKAIIALGKDNKAILSFFGRVIKTYATHSMKVAVTQQGQFHVKGMWSCFHLHAPARIYSEILSTEEWLLKKKLKQWLCINKKETYGYE